MAFAALKTDGSVITWGDPDFGGDSTSVATSLSNGVAWIASPFNITWSLTTIKAGSGTGSISSDPSGVACTATCSTSFVRPVTSMKTIVGTDWSGSPAVS